MTQSMASMFLFLSENGESKLDGLFLVRSYLDSPRVTITNVVTSESEEQVKLGFHVDLLKNNLRVLSNPGNAINAENIFRSAQSILDSVSEGQIIQSISDTSSLPKTVQAILEVASNTGVPIILIEPNNIAKVELLEISSDAKARISMAIRSGKFVLTPNRMVVINNQNTLGWFELNPISGEIIGVLDDGSFGVYDEYGFLLRQLTPAQQTGFIFGYAAGVITAYTTIAPLYHYYAEAAIKLPLKEYILNNVSRAMEQVTQRLLSIVRGCIKTRLSKQALNSPL